jgi:anaerobic selenocysteine-containing dehydrogenase
MNRGLVNGLFHALGTSRLQAGTVCDTCCETAWDMTLGPVGGADPESVIYSDLVVSWGADLAATNVHFWALAESAAQEARGMPIVVIDPRRTRSARAADLHLPIRIGTDAALALGVMHILVRDGLANRDYIAVHTRGFDKVERDVLPRFTPARTAEITGLSVADIEKFAAMYGRAKAALIRLGEGMTRLVNGGQALRSVVLLPGVTGHYGGEGRRLAAADGGVVRSQLRRRAQAFGPGDGTHGEPPASRRRAPEHEGPAAARAVSWLGQQSGRDLPGGAQGPARA